MMIGPRFFIHIPKTAGTSFRIAAEDYFGSSQVVYDYGDKVEQTSALTHDFIYPDGDFLGFYRACIKERKALIAGHVAAERFVAGTGVQNSITFLRDPIQRIMSHYLHFVRHKGFDRSFRDFYQQSHRGNTFGRFLKGLPLEALGVVGITEQYDESIRLINHYFGWEIPYREENLGKKNIQATYDISAEDQQSLASLCADDMALYRSGVSLLEQRIRWMDQGMPYAHAKLETVSHNQVSGWAWWADGSEKAVNVEVYCNDALLAIVPAQTMKASLCWLRPPREAHVGFSANLKLRAGDEVQCRVAETGQVFPLVPWKFVGKAK